MGTHSNQGFTIIETMLVLAVTGVMVAGLLVGLGSSINNQRYLDSVSSFKSFIQEQYLQLSNVTNDRDENWTCDSSAVPVEVNGGTAPGQSNCVLLGVGIVDDRITTAVVVGYPIVDAASSSTIALVKSNYVLGISKSSIEQNSLEWGAQIAWPRTGVESSTPTTPRSLAMLLINSPENGTIYTFTSDTVNEIDSVSSLTLSNMIVTSLTATNPGQGARAVCIEPAGLNVPEKLALYIGAGASTTGAIEVRSSGLFEDAGLDTRC
jgi:prepilin-type N-terminal cleavage/methylation domain-containing protein